MTIGREFGPRGKDHHDGAKSPKSSLNFYSVYPAKESGRSNKRDKQGSFENLVQVIAGGFDPSTTSAKQADKDFREGGIMILSSKDKQKIKECLKDVDSSIKKFHTILAYQFELGYDLAISPDVNVSRNPGYETVIGVFSGSSDE